ENEDAGADDAADAYRDEGAGAEGFDEPCALPVLGQLGDGDGGEDSTLAHQETPRFEFARDSTTGFEAEARRAFRYRPCLRLAQSLRDVRGEQFHERLVCFWRPRDDVAALSIRLAGERADAAAGLLDEQRAGRRIPGFQANLPERIGPAGCDISEIEC